MTRIEKTGALVIVAKHRKLGTGGRFRAVVLLLLTAMVLGGAGCREGPTPTPPGPLIGKKKDPYADWRCEGFKGWRELEDGGLIIDCANNTTWPAEDLPLFGTKHPKRTSHDERKQLDLMQAHLPVGGQSIDLGAGSGFYTLPMAERVGPEGRVWAIDIDSSLVRLLSETFRVLDMPQVRALAVDERFDPRIRPGTIDLVNGHAVGLTCAKMRTFLRSCLRVLKPGGFVLFDVDYPRPSEKANPPCRLPDVEPLVRQHGFQLKVHRFPSRALLELEKPEEQIDVDS